MDHVTIIPYDSLRTSSLTQVQTWSFTSLRIFCMTNSSPVFHHAGQTDLFHLQVSKGSHPFVPIEDRSPVRLQHTQDIMSDMPNNSGHGHGPNGVLHDSNSSILIPLSSVLEGNGVVPPHPLRSIRASGSAGPEVLSFPNPCPNQIGLVSGPENRSHSGVRVGSGPTPSPDSDSSAPGLVWILHPQRSWIRRKQPEGSPRSSDLHRALETVFVGATLSLYIPAPSNRFQPAT